MFKGSHTALITPFDGKSIDEKSFRSLIDFQISEGIHGLVPVGTTGESPTLSHEEHKLAVEICVEETAKRVPVIAGTGSNNTDEAIDLTMHAEKAGADGALVVTPYYNKPTQHGLYSHFEAISKATTLPIIIYNIPGRSIVDMSIDTMIELSKVKNIIGVKDATNDLFRPLLTRKKMQNNFCYLSGEDGTALAYLAQGGSGCISVTANVAPKLCSEMHSAWQKGNIIKSQEINLKLSSLHEALFIESSPGPVKYAASLLGLCNENTRLPLSEIKENTKKVVKRCLQELNLL